MAQSHGQEGGHPAMDYKEHEGTYDGFIRFSTLGTIWCVTIVIGLAIGGPGKSWAWGSFLIFLSTAATALGLFVKEVNAKAAIGVLILALLIGAPKMFH